MAFQTGISGMNAASRNLDVIGNNIANSSTVGFKKSRAEFADVYSVGAFGGGTNAVGNGVRLSRVQQNFGQGGISYTNNALDLRIEGGGFFVLNDQGSRSFTRAGMFGVDNEGFVVNAQKQRLTGYQPNGTGGISTIAGDLRLDVSDIPPSATTLVEGGFNLFANATAPGVDWAGGATPAIDTYNNNSSARIYDSLGNSHVLTMYFIKADANAAAGDPNAADPPGTQNQWYVAFQIDNQNVPANAGAQNVDNLYRVNFNQDGSLASIADTANNPVPNNQIPLSMVLGNGAAPLSFNVDLANTTQFGSPFATQAINPNGYANGQINGLSVDASGVILGAYTNGQTRAMGQVMLANFSNPDGLMPIGDTAWIETQEAGQPLFGQPGSGTLGLIQGGALEESNVDITSELVGLIGAQRDFQANAQTIRTADAITQTIINIR